MITSLPATLPAQTLRSQFPFLGFPDLRRTCHPLRQARLLIPFAADCHGAQMFVQGPLLDLKTEGFLH